MLSRKNIVVGFSSLTLAASLLLSVSQSFALERGAKAPDIGGAEAGFTKTALHDSEPVRYVQFWASWCQTCRSEMKWIKNLESKFPGKDFKVISVNLDQNSADAKRLLAELGPIDFKVIYDSAGKLPEQYEVTDMPSAFLVGKDGKIAAVHHGYCPTEEAGRENEIRQALNAH